MRLTNSRTPRSTLVLSALMLVVSACSSSSTSPSSAPAQPAVSSSLPSAPDVRFETFPGFVAPGTPEQYNKVGVIETGPSSAKNILVLVPGTSASAAYFEPLAKDIVGKSKGWQVWAVERRENLLEDHSVFDQAKQGKASTQQVFDYYLGWLANQSITTHFQPVPDSNVAFARQWA